MAYSKTTWTDRIVQKPLTYTQQNNGDGTTTLIPAEGTITQAGTPITATALNNMENGIADALPKTGGGTVVGDVGVQGQLSSEGEAHFAYDVGKYVDPRPNTRAALKATGGIATDNLYIGDAKMYIGHDVNGGIVFVPDSNSGQGRYILYTDQGYYLSIDDGLGAVVISAGGSRIVFNWGDPTFRIERWDGGPCNLIVSMINGSSDRTKKKNIAVTKDSALDAINQTKIYNFHFDGDDEKEVCKRTGIMADEAPECVVGDDGKSVNLYNMISVAWKGIQELSDKVQTLEARIAELEA